MNLEDLYSRIPQSAIWKLKGELGNFSEIELDYFYSKIGTYDSMEQLQKNYHEEISNPISQKIFLFDLKGIGAGEIWCAWLIKNAIISGGGESYDLTVGDNLYEIKAYNFFPHYKTKEKRLYKYNGPWRLGNAGAMTNFKFVDNLIKNAQIAHLVADTEIEHPDVKKMKYLIDKIERKSETYGMVGDFARGEVSQEKMKWMIEFINTANLYVNRNKTEYDIVNFGSTTPGNPNVTYVVKEMTADQLDSGKFEIIRQVDMNDHNDPVVFDRILSKSKYIREGVKSMIDDINDDITKVEEKYSGIQFVVFRKSGINITDTLKKIENRTKKGLLEAVGEVFQLSSASVRVKEEVV